MVFQMPAPDKSYVFVASNAEDSEKAAQEIQCWASGQDYCPVPAGQTFTIYSPHAGPREWTLFERRRD